MNPRRASVVVLGAALCLTMALAAANLRGPAFIAALERQADVARAGAGGRGVKMAFRDGYGWLTRHPALSGGNRLGAATRTRVAEAIARVPGIGGISWVREGEGTGEAPRCQDDVKRILETRTIRFNEASARIDPASDKLLGEVARALRPCVGSIIAVIGHTDAGGDPRVNLTLSMARAESVRWALVARGIPADGLRATGMGSKQPVAGLDPLDPANRRIEFSVISPAPVKPTPIDTPGPM